MALLNKNDAEFCGKVPLNQTNLVQPHGYLLVLDAQSLQLVQAGENASALFGRPVRELVTTTLHELLPAGETDKLQERFSLPVNGRLPFLINFPDGPHLAVVKQQPPFLIMEVEGAAETGSATDSFISVYLDLRYVMSAIEEARSTQEVCTIAVQELKRISGFDKVMVYQFDEEWNGDVVAEAMEPGMDAYVGLKFPASDIPRQARELYRRTPYRLIPTIDYEPVRLYPVINPVTNVFTDLSDSNLRSVAGVHLEYLRNMKVMASMSTRIMKDDRLWGLIACHHRTPKYLSFQTCALFELLSNLISGRIAAMQHQDSFSFRNGKQGIYTDLTEAIFSSSYLNGTLQQEAGKLAELLGADGIAVCQNQQVFRYGPTPDGPEIDDLLIWLQANDTARLYHQSALPAVYEPAAAYREVASGLLALPVQAEKGSFILAFRPEALQKIAWGGNPNEAVQFETDGRKYHPRASFRLWQQQVTGRAIPWNPEELEVAEQFRSFLVEHTLNKMIQ